MDTDLEGTQEKATRARKEPRLAVVMGCLLAFLSAGVNACYAVGVGTSVSHLTGDVSKVALGLASHDDTLSAAILHLLAAACGFVGGAMSAGYWIHHPVISFSRPYGRSLVGISLCLLLAQRILPQLPFLSILLAGMACGFQNALATHYRGMILRTTHVTGILTDLGTSLGMRLKGLQVERWRLLVPLCLVTAFFLGAVAGCAAFVRWQMDAVLLYAGLYALAGLAWGAGKHRTA